MPASRFTGTIVKRRQRQSSTDGSRGLIHAYRLSLPICNIIWQRTYFFARSFAQRTRLSAQAQRFEAEARFDQYNYYIYLLGRVSQQGPELWKTAHQWRYDHLRWTRYRFRSGS